jgi:hypothetical protein
MTVFQSLARVAIAAVITLFTLMPAVTAEERESGAVGPSVAQVPSARTFGFNLAAGAFSAPVVVPANVPVQVMGVMITPGFRGVGQVALLRIPGQFLEWVGLDSTAGAAITQGFSGAAGTKIVFIDFAHQVQIEVASPDAIRVRNLSGGQRTGRVTLIW